MQCRKYALYFAWLFALAGTLGSLYFSEIKNIDPCHLCWLQRVALFPLALILGIATYRGFYGIAAYAIPLAVFGLLIALYQIGIQEIPGWMPIDICGDGPSCSKKIYIGLGPITLPMLSAANFFVIAVLLLIAPFRAKRSSV